MDKSRYLHYKDYLGSVEYCDEDKILHGHLLGIRSLVMYHGTSVELIAKDFQDAVDHYLSACEAEGIEPNKPNYDSIINN